MRWASAGVVSPANIPSAENPTITNVRMAVCLR
jgi:hypothetical protein